MNRETWTEVRNILSGALSVPEDERESYLVTQCGKDQSLLTLVRELLSGSGELEESGFLDPPIPDVASRMLLFQGAEESLGEKIGAYRLSEVLGVGGMGTVFRAERDDPALSMQVAIKILHRSLQTEEHLRAFQREQKLLARLNHPFICRLFDLGTREDGSPYLIMELIEGRPLLNQQDESGSSLSERLTLFRKVCSAIHYAHGNLVIHRDLKPSNILITPSFEPKVIDFGIAGITTCDPGGVAEDEALGLSVQFASPEQLRGESLTTGSDVFSLGVILKELVGDDCPEEVRSIARRATELDVADRYVSVEELTHDLLMYERGHPVNAHGGGRGYVFRKFVRRHRAPLLIVSGLFILILSFAIVASILAVNLDREREAVERMRKSESLARKSEERAHRFLRETLALASPERLGAEATIVMALEDAGKRMHEEFFSEPSVALQVHLAIADTFESLGMSYRAEAHLRAAIEMIEKEPERETVVCAEVMQKLGEILSYQNRQEGLSLQEEALRILRKMTPRPDESPQIASALHALGFAVYRCARPPRIQEALAILEEAKEHYIRIYGHDDLHVARILHALAAVHARSENFALSADIYARSYQLYEAHEGLASPQALECRMDRAICLSRLGKCDEAEDELEEIISLSKGRFSKAWTLLLQNSLGEVSFRRQDEQSALNWFCRSLAGQCKLLEETLGSPAGEELGVLASLVLEPQGEVDRSKWVLLTIPAIRPHQEKLEKKGILCVSSLLGIGRVQNKLKDPGTAELVLRFAREIAEESMAEQDVYSGRIGRELGESLLALGREEEARSLFAGSLSLFEGALGEDHSETKKARALLMR